MSHEKLSTSQFSLTRKTKLANNLNAHECNVHIGNSLHSSSGLESASNQGENKNRVGTCFCNAENLFGNNYEIKITTKE